MQSSPKSLEQIPLYRNTRALAAISFALLAFLSLGIVVIFVASPGPAPRATTIELFLIGMISIALGILLFSSIALSKLKRLYLLAFLTVLCSSSVIIVAEVLLIGWICPLWFTARYSLAADA